MNALLDVIEIPKPQKPAGRIDTYSIKIYLQVCREWREIAMITREKVFKETEQGQIDLFDVKVCC